jgi:ABC-type Fe3+-hydroxamate transport system substrate-binding protein
MKHSVKNLWVAFVAITFVLTTACTRESKQDQPIRTTTDRGSSTAAPASDAEKRDKAMLRLVNALPEWPTVDVFSGETKAFANVSYKTVTPYTELGDNRQRLAVKDPSDTQTLVENSENFAGGRHYTAIALPGNGKDPKPDLKVIADDLKPPSPGKARVRVINASPDAGELDVYVMNKAEKLFGGVNFRSEAGYTEIDPTTTVVELRPQGKKQPLVTVPQFNFEPNKTYTIIVMGHHGKGPAKGQKLEAVAVEDQFVTS